MTIPFRTPYSGKRHRVSIAFLDEDGNQALGRTKQDHKDMCDINQLLRHYDRTGLITHVNNAVAHYGDYTEVNEYQESLNIVMKAQNAFGELPSDVRSFFKNDPGAFMEFATNPENHSKMVDLGLAEAKPTPPLEENNSEVS